MSSKDQNIAQKVTLPLAEKMCQKFFAEGKIEAEAEVELFLMILEKQKKYKEMLEVMESPIGEKLSNHLDFLSRRKADLIRLEGRHKDAFDAYKLLIENNIDQIEYYLELFNICFVLDENQLNTSEDSIIDEKHDSYHYISEAIILIDKCIEKGNNNSMKSSGIKTFQPQRGPYLAKMVLYQSLNKRQQTQGNVDHLLKRIANSLTDLLFEYFVEFGTKHASVYDMCYILDKSDLSTDEIECVSLFRQYV